MLIYNDISCSQVIDLRQEDYEDITEVPRLTASMMQMDRVLIPSDVLQEAANKVLEKACDDGEFDSYFEIEREDYVFNFCLKGQIVYSRHNDPVHGRKPEYVLFAAGCYCEAWGEREAFKTDFSEREFEEYVIS